MSLFIHYISLDMSVSQTVFFKFLSKKFCLNLVLFRFRFLVLLMADGGE